MVIGLACNCHGAPGLFRQFLFENHVKDIFSIPLYQGKDARTWADENSARDILNYLEKRSSFVLVVGTNGDEYEWSDINNADPERTLRAEMILERFA